MDFAHLFVGFFQPVIVGSAAVFLLLGFIAVGTPHRSPIVVSRKPHR